MVDSNDNKELTPTGKNKDLLCPDCEKLWHSCQCSTSRMDLSELATPFLGSKGNVTATGKTISDSIESDEVTESLLGKLIASKYELIDVLGEGGSSSVYLCEHLVLRKKYALKILHKNLLENQVAVERLQREAQACASLSHQNVVSVSDFGITDNGFPFLVMDYLEGASLNSLCKLDAQRTVSLALDICSGLMEAHKNGIVHRDLKPSNIIITNPGTSEERAIIVDFGIAKTEFPGGEMQHLTQTGDVLGSPAYMSPEQIHGKTVDERSDIYSLGCILFEAITGKQLFRGHTFMSIMEANLRQEEPGLSEESKAEEPKLKVLESILKRCLKKDREERYESVAELKSDLEKIDSAHTQATGKKASATRTLSIMFLTFIAVSGLFLMFRETIIKSQISSSDSYEKEILPARFSELTEFPIRAKRQYKEAFEHGSTVNVRFLAATEYIQSLKDGFGDLKPNQVRKFMEDLVGVKKQIAELVAKAVKNSKPWDPRVAALAFYVHSTSMDDIREVIVHKAVPEQDDFAGFTMVARYACKTSKDARNLYDDSAGSLEIATKLMENGIKKPSDDDRVHLSVMYGYLGEKLLILGRDKPAIESFNKAIKLLEESKPRYNNHLIWWRSDLARAYLITGQMTKALEQKQKAEKLLRKTRDQDSKDNYKKLVEEIDFIKERRKKSDFNKLVDEINSEEENKK